MSVSTPTSHTELATLAIRPGGPIVDGTWETMAGNAHHAYARGGARIPIYWGDDAITTSSVTYAQPSPIDELTAVWRPTRVTVSDRYRYTLYVYGVDLDVRVTTYDATVSGGGSLGTETLSCGATAEWASVEVAIQDTSALSGGVPIPLAITLEIKTSSTTAELYQAYAVGRVLTTAYLP